MMQIIFVANVLTIIYHNAPMLDNISLCQSHQNIVKLNFRSIITCIMRLPFTTLIINVTFVRFTLICVTN